MSPTQAQFLRSQLFVPVLAEKFVVGAASRGADAMVVDLEDSIAPDKKERARNVADQVVRQLADSGAPVFVRVNNTPAHLQADLEAISRSPVAGIFLPKAEDPTQVAEVSRSIGQAEARRGLAAGTIALALLLESPLALCRAQELATCDRRVVALVFGSEDYATALGVSPTLEAMRIPASLVGIAARAHGLAAWGLAGSIAEFTDLGRYRSMAETARDAGYTGALAIHPRQIAVLNEVFGVAESELTEALEIIDAYDRALADGAGAVAHRGKMLDIPVVERARRVVAKARR